MLPALKRQLAEGLLVVADLAGVMLFTSGAAVVAFFGKLMLAIVLGAVALGFFLRLSGRRRKQSVVPVPVPAWARAASALGAAVEVAVLVEATNLPVRFDQAGFQPWHWLLVVAAWAVAYPLNLRGLQSVIRRRGATAQP